MYFVHAGKKSGNKFFLPVRWFICCVFIIAVCLACSLSFAGSFSRQPQYTIPVRRSVFSILSLLYPHYRELYQLVRTSHPKLFLLGPDYKEWMENNQDAIRERVFDASTCD